MHCLTVLCLTVLCLSVLCLTVQMNDYGDLSYLTDARYEQQLVELSQGAELVTLPIGTRGFTAGKVGPYRT